MSKINKGKLKSTWKIIIQRYEELGKRMGTIHEIVAQVVLEKRVAFKLNQSMAFPSLFVGSFNLKSVVEKE